MALNFGLMKVQIFLISSEKNVSASNYFVKDDQSWLTFKLL